MSKPGRATQEAIRAAMEAYEQRVLDNRYSNLETGHHQYPYPVTEKEVLLLASIKSRSTLKASYHAAIKSDLKIFIQDLKIKAGKKEPTASVAGRGDVGEESTKTSNSARLEQLAETIGALAYKIIVLERELLTYRSKKPPETTVVNLLSRSKRNPKSRRY